MSFLRIFVALSLVLGLPLFTHAKPNAAPPTVPHATLMQHLTPEERVCRVGGLLVQFIAVDRDALVPLTTTLARLRIILATPSVELERDMLSIAQMLYRAPTVSGARARQVFETGCLDTVPMPVVR